MWKAQSVRKEQGMSDGQRGRNVVVMGRGGQGRVVMDTVIAAGHDVTGILDDSPEPPAQ